MNQTFMIRRRTVGEYPFEPLALRPGEPRSLFVYDDVVVDRIRQEVYRDGEAVYLTKKEYALLTVLIDHPNVALTRERLLFLVWGYTVAGDTRTVDVHVKQLRKKLGWQERICTVFRVGYRFIA